MSAKGIFTWVIVVKNLLLLTLLLSILKSNAQVVVTDLGTTVVLENGILKAAFRKSNANIVSLKFKGKDVLKNNGTTHSGAYYSWNSPAFGTMGGCVYSVSAKTTDLVDISFKKTSPPFDVDAHYVLKKGDSALYVYNQLEHPTTYPDFFLGEYRIVFWLPSDPKNSNEWLFENTFHDGVRDWKLGTVYDYSKTAPTTIGEIAQFTTGARKGLYDSKYTYSTELYKHPAVGNASDVNKMGIFTYFPSLEYFNQGPAYHDLVNGADVLHVYLNGDHYSGPMITVRNGEYYKKFFGPFALYCSGKGTASQCWQDAKDRQKKDAAEWPFTWMSHNSEYPQKNQRGSVSGVFSIKDAAKPTINTTGSWIGLTQFDTTNKSEDFQHEAKHYQYWAKVGANGVFSIPNVRPGTYKLFAYQTGEVGQYEQENIVVSAAKDTKMGTVTWTIPRNKGDLVWEIGIADRRTNEYKLGSDHYFDGFIYNDFYKYFANPLEYTVENKNWADALCYAHSSYKQDTNAAVPWSWNLIFTLKNKPTTGVATFTIAFAGNDRGSMIVTVNGKQISKFYPPNGGGNALLRQSNFAKYGVTQVQIPVTNLKVGKNTINLYNSMTGHVMYDYMSFEMANSVITSIDEFSTENTETLFAYPNPFHDKTTLKSEGDFSFTITSISGASILKGNATTKIEVGENLEPGVYLVNVENSKGNVIYKIVKQ